jgi:hypothetical protein
MDFISIVFQDCLDFLENKRSSPWKKTKAWGIGKLEGTSTTTRVGILDGASCNIEIKK